MSDKLNPSKYPEQAAHEVVLEMARAGKLSHPLDVANAFTHSDESLPRGTEADPAGE